MPAGAGPVPAAPEPPAVRLYDRSADRQSHADPLRFGGEKRSKQPIRMFRFDSQPGIFNGYEKFTRI